MQQTTKLSAMVNKLMDPIGRLMGLRYKSHPWHGVDIGDDAPEVIISFIEMVSTDTVKYEVDKVLVFPKETYKKGDYVQVKVKDCTTATLIGTLTI